MSSRRLIILVTLVVSAAVPALALAGLPFPDNQYEGRIEADPHTYFGFDVVRQDGHRKVKHVTFDAPYSCYDGAHGYIAEQVPGSFGVHEDGSFGGTHEGTIKGSTTKYTVRGELLRHGKARGWFKFRATMGGDVCYTGLLDWRTKRGAEVVPEPPPPPGP